MSLKSFFSEINSDGKQDFDLIRICIAGPESIAALSYGEVTKPETINYRTFKPEKGGFFCARIFGPISDYECICGKYKRVKHKGVVCHKCGVEVTVARVRRERMGHITLAAPVAHVWFLRSLPSRIGLLLNMSLKDLERVLYFESHVIVESNVPSIEKGSLISEDEVFNLQDQFGTESFAASIGGEAIEKLLREVDLVALRQELHISLNTCGTELKRRKILKRLKVVDQFIESGNRPEWMMIKILPVLPPQLRPLVPLDGGRFAASDLNDLYRRVLNRNNRLKRLIELKAPDIIIRNEKRMLQEAVDALLDNSRGDKILKNTGKRPLKSIADMLKGKHGRFRQNLLGKRVDYSGRSVIVVGPKLKLHECGIPKSMALELFKPFVYAKLIEYGLASTIRAAKRMIESSRPEVWDILEEVIKEHPVLLNRAPTLHRLGIQAFEPVLAEGQAIQLHPLVCSAFNADFDGDQMAVHVPLSIEAQVEARVLMMSTNNILSPASGNPVILPEQDIVLGLYYLTVAVDDLGPVKPAFASMQEVEFALEFGKITLHSRIRYRLPSGHLVEATAGRLKLFELLPEHPQITFDLVNRLLSKRDLSKLIQIVRRHCGPKTTVIFADKMMELGFQYSYQAGLSWGMDDMAVPQSRDVHIANAKKSVEEFESQYQEGLITQGEKYNKVVDAWLQCTERVTDDLVKLLSFKDGQVKSIRDINSIHVMSDSGARGTTTQIKQVSGMRGLMNKPSGEIIETPILSNFKEGLTVLEYFISTHGARKGLADTALKTANSGYLTRRLVDVSLDCVVLAYDCGTQDGILMTPLVLDGRVATSLSERVFGRVVVNDVFGPTGDLIVAAGELIDESHSDQIEKSGIPSMKVRSVLTCAAKEGVCAKCYGRDLSAAALVSPGEAVGVIAAQSIGEPGTQLTMKTFHIGGAASGAVESSYVDSGFSGVLKLASGELKINSQGQNVVLSSSCELAVIGSGGLEIARYHVPYGATVLASAGDQVEEGRRIAEWDPYSLPVIAECEGRALLVDIIEGSTLKGVVDHRTGLVKRVVTEPRGGQTLSPRVEVVTDKGGAAAFVRYLPPNAVLLACQDDLIKAGDILAKLPRELTRSRDITGGLPKVIEIVEARKPKEPSIVAEFDGVIEFGKESRNKRTIALLSSDGTRSLEYSIPKGRQILVSDGEIVAKGKAIVEGQLALQDILRIDGIEALAKHVVIEIQSVYMLQGVKINDKHIEIIVKQMLQKVKVVDAGDSAFFSGEKIDKREFDKANAKLISHSMRPAKGELIVSGITKAATQATSFISSAAFQETTRVLTEAAIAGRVDELRSIKENVITGRLIPAGTGFYAKELQSGDKSSDTKSN